MIEALALIKPSALRALHREADEILSIIISAIKTTKSRQTTK